MVDPIKGCVEINLQNSSFPPTLQCTLHCMGHVQKYITGTLTFLMFKMGGWKHTTDFHKSSLTNRHHTLVKENHHTFANYFCVFWLYIVRVSQPIYTCQPVSTVSLDELYIANVLNSLEMVNHSQLALSSVFR